MGTCCEACLSTTPEASFLPALWLPARGPRLDQWAVSAQGVNFKGTSQVIYCVVNHLIGEGNGNPLQYSCLENPMDGGAWQPGRLQSMRFL